MKGKWTFRKLIGVVIVVFFFIGLFATLAQGLMDSISPERKLIRAKEQATADSLVAVRKRQVAVEDSLDAIKEQNDKILTSAYVLSQNIIVESLKDPDSFDLRDYNSYFTNDGSVQVWIEYTATNSFGGRIKSKYYFDYDKNLKYLSHWKEF